MNAPKRIDHLIGLSHLPGEPCPICSSELPFQTYARVFRRPWPGGRSDEVIELLRQYGIEHRPGSAKANLALQERLR